MSMVTDNPPAEAHKSSDSTAADQRKFRRFGVKLSCRVKPKGPRKGELTQELEVETQDVSRGGMFFLTSTDLMIGTSIEFELDLPALVAGSPARIRCKGTVTRVVPQEEGRVGIGATIDHYKISPIVASSRKSQ